MSQRTRRRLWIWGLTSALVLAVGAAGAVLIGGLPGNDAEGRGAAGDNQSNGDLEPLLVKVIHPKLDPSLQITVHQLATVEPFFQSDQRARVSGLVRSVPKDINDPVRAGEMLLDIEVPDLDFEVAQREVVISQRRQEVLLAEARLKLAQAERDTALAMVKQRQAEIGQYAALADSRRKQATRLKAMAAREAIQPERVEEGERDALAAESAAQAAHAAVEKANADVHEKEAGISAARADIEMRRTMVEVARQDYERTLAQARYARLLAPFDGVIVRRNVDPGSFVQNATSGASETLISVARTDLVTISAHFPDNAAPFIKAGIPATIELDELPEVTISGTVTRLSPSIRNTDRTMRVEVDLFNGTPAEHDRFKARTLAAALVPLGAAGPAAAAVLTAASRDSLASQRKGPRDPLPEPAFTDNAAAVRLLAGMTGTMRLQLSRPRSSSVIPSTAIYTRGGKTYLLLVRSGVTQQVAVRVHVNDGTLAKVSVIERPRDDRGQRERLRELSIDDEIVASRQIEIGPGQRVTTAPEEW
jgi:multidrug resistance efflux pump